MRDLIAALQILLKYGNPRYPTVCAHDLLVVVGIDPGNVTPEDTERLEQLGFTIDRTLGSFVSHRFGSA